MSRVEASCSARLQSRERRGSWRPRSGQQVGVDEAIVDSHPRKTLAVAVLSKADRCGGGASLIAEDLAGLLIEAGHRADHWIGWAGRQPRHNTRLLHGGWTACFIRRAHWVARQFGLPDLIPWEYLLLRRHLPTYDVLHFHDLPSAVSPYTLRWAARRIPTIWTFHDCSPFTGGCLYPLDCTAFHDHCGRCPQLDRWPLGGRLGLDFTRTLQSIKRKTAAEERFTAVAPSQWMADEAMKSGMFASRPRVIPNWVDSELFHPLDRAAARAKLGLARDGFWTLVSAGALADRRKGARHAIEAIRRSHREISVLLVGHKDPALLDLLSGVRFHAAGYLSDPRQLALHYAAADVLAFPTQADNLPCTILETMATGTPTVGFRVGGVPDLVEHRVTGYLAEPGDVPGMVAGLQLAFDGPILRQQWADAGRRRAVEQFNRRRFTDAHLELYREVLAARPPITE